LRLKQIEIGFAATAQTIWSDAQVAYQSWAQWEAINDCFAGPAGSELGERLLQSGLDQSIGATRSGLSRDTIIRVYQLSEPVAKSGASRGHSLCEAADDLRQPGFYAHLTSKAWAADHALDTEEYGSAASRTVAQLENFLSLVVPDWSAERPKNGELADLHARVRSVRNEMVHGIKADELSKPTINDVRRLLELTLKLSADFALVATGQLLDNHAQTAVTLEEFIATTNDQAQRFWQRTLGQFAPVNVGLRRDSV
jgi:hypothetical protein